MAPDAVAQALGQRKPRLPESREHGLAHQLQLLVENPLEKLLLRAEIVVEHGVRDTRRLGDRGGPLEALGQKLPLGGTEDGILPIMKRFCHGIGINKLV